MAQLTSSRTRAIKLAAPVVAGLFLLGACSKKDEPVTSSGSNGNSNSNSQTTSGSGSKGTSGGSTNDTSGGSKGTSAAASTALNQTVWFNGFKITLGDVKKNTTDK